MKTKNQNPKVQAIDSALRDVKCALDTLFDVLREMKLPNSQMSSEYMNDMNAMVAHLNVAKNQMETTLKTIAENEAQNVATEKVESTFPDKLNYNGIQLVYSGERQKDIRKVRIAKYARLDGFPPIWVVDDLTNPENVSFFYDGELALSTLTKKQYEKWKEVEKPNHISYQRGRITVFRRLDSSIFSYTVKGSHTGSFPKTETPKNFDEAIEKLNDMFFKKGRTKQKDWYL